ncbi:protein CHUP1, chloroplastic [Tripterygium wilfordii]|uniref:protein CHUP1, chloroplastic n=1 Tax=Tripterygium wilfordii TaxID=458696 RepID=UPI0018F83181|nr:protein CHUP1, chloroplastic [Tripterygium wilfordii]
MENTASKAEVIRPVFLKAGIPLAISAAGFLFATIIARRRTSVNSSSPQTQVSSHKSDYSHEDSMVEDSDQSINSTSLRCEDDEMEITTSPQLIESLGIPDKCSFDEEILGLRTTLDECHQRERVLEMHFLSYQAIKEHESVLMEMSNTLLLEIARVEFMDRELSSVEAVNNKFDNLVVDYLRLLESFDLTKLENGLLKRKVKKLLRKTIKQSRIIREKNSKIEAREAEVLRTCQVLESRSSAIKKLEDEVKELQTVVDQVREERNELLRELNSAEKSASPISKSEAEGVTVEDYNQLLNEFEKLQKERAAEMEDLIYLRWSNACLKHQLMMNQEQQKQIDLTLEFQEGEDHGYCGEEQQFDVSVVRHGEPSSSVAIDNKACPKRRKLLQKLKRWVLEGSDDKKLKLEKQEGKCFGRFSVSDEPEEERASHPRRSCSSA